MLFLLLVLALAALLCACGQTAGSDAAPGSPAAAPEEGTLLEAMQALPARDRAVLHLYYYEGYQAAEIGQILGIPTATVHTRLARGRARLKTLLGGMEYEQSV